MKRIVIFGGSGFIGTRLARRLLAAHHSVRLADIHQSEAYPEHWVPCDVRDVKQVLEACRDVDVIINLAAAHHDDVRPLDLYQQVNVDGARNVCQAAAQLDIPWIIFTSSVAVYGLPERELDETAPPNPFNAYGRTKLAAEGVYREWLDGSPHRSLLVVRPTVVFGEGNRGNFYNLLRQLSSGRFVMVGDGKNRKSVAYVENVAAFIEHLLNLDGRTGTFNYVDKPDFEMNELVDLVRAKLRRNRGSLLRIPYWLGYTTSLALDAIAAITRRRFPISSIRIRKFCSNTIFAAQRAYATGFKPRVALKDAIERTIASEFGQSR